MDAESFRKFELNEVNWWSNWANLTWFGEAYLLSSNRFREYFFNRGGFLGCPAPDDALPDYEGQFSRIHLAPHLMVKDSCASLMGRLNAAGYHKIDGMLVLTSEMPNFKRNDELVIGQLDGDSVARWTETYLLAFYGELSLRREVETVVSALVGRDEPVLVCGSLDGTAAGVLAMYRSPGVLGVYCVGTHPAHRNQGVAGTLLQHAFGVAKREGRELMLQTIASDNVEGFYLDGGFRRRYTKQILRKGDASGS